MTVTGSSVRRKGNGASRSERPAEGGVARQAPVASYPMRYLQRGSLHSYRVQRSFTSPVFSSLMTFSVAAISLPQRGQRTPAPPLPPATGPLGADLDHFSSASAAWAAASRAMGTRKGEQLT